MRGTGVEYRPVCEFAPDYDAEVPWVRTFLWQLIVGIIGLLLFTIGMICAAHWDDCHLTRAPDHPPEEEEPAPEPCQRLPLYIPFGYLLDNKQNGFDV